MITWGFVMISIVKMFRFQKVATSGARDFGLPSISVDLTFTTKILTFLIDFGLPFAIAAVNICIFDFFVRQMLRDSSRNRTNIDIILRTPVCALYILAMAAPFKSLSPQLQNHWMLNLSKLEPIVHLSQTYYVANGYGLFRRMTGVAQHNYQAGDQWGTAGLPPSIVARPEIILEGEFGNQWREIEFWSKPGATNVLPRQVAPHQPRLDWQMWFAALGQYQHNPWLIHLVDKILEGCEPVTDLLGDTLLATGHVPSKVRARLYHYDFTRLNTTWARQMPNVQIESSKELSNSDGSVWKELFQFPDRYWTRTYVGEYTVAIESNNTSVKAFLEHHRYERRCDRKKRWDWIRR